MPQAGPLTLLDPRFNGVWLQIPNVPAKQYELFEGDTTLGRVSGKELGAGIDLMTFESLSIVERPERLAALNAERQLLLGRAWLDHVGHQRPDTPKGLPLAEAEEKAAALEERIRELAQPAVLSLRLVPVD
jgi:hypothetical protein